VQADRRRGLYLLVTPNGSASPGKAQELSMDVYPDVSLRLARERRVAGRALPAQGINPSAAAQS
jgi:hypothetical protein